MLNQSPQPNRLRRLPSVPARPRRVGIVGGGVAGLVAAYRRMLAGDDVTLFESDGRLGGQLWSDVRDGFVVEHGAEGFAPSSPAILTLARELGISQQIVEQRVHRSYEFDGRELAWLEAGEAPARLGLRVPLGQRGQGIASFRGGMGQLVNALLERIRDRVAVRLNEPVWQLLASGSCWELGTGSFARVRVDSVVLATGSRVAGRLLKHLAEDSLGFEKSQAVSSVTVSLAYPRSAIGHELDATGFVVAEPSSLEACRACTFSSSKLPARSPEGEALLRLFFRPPLSEVEDMSDRAWTARAERVLARVLGVKGRPARGWVDRWPEALAVVDAEQRRRVAVAERRLYGRGILLAGSAFYGAGIEAAVSSGEAAAAALDGSGLQVGRAARRSG
jgi:oxygen-dependent protoporphyrinogen oxidase